MRLTHLLIVLSIVLGISMFSGVIEAQESKTRPSPQVKKSGVDKKPPRRVVRVRSTVDVIDPRENISDIISKMRTDRKREITKDRTRTHSTGSHPGPANKKSSPGVESDTQNRDRKIEGHEKDRGQRPPAEKKEHTPPLDDDSKKRVKHPYNAPSNRAGRSSMQMDRMGDQRRRRGTRPPQMHPPSQRQEHKH